MTMNYRYSKNTRLVEIVNLTEEDSNEEWELVVIDDKPKATENLFFF